MKPTLKNNWYPEDDDVNPQDDDVNSDWDADWDDVVDPSDPPKESEQI